jgi:hypothetical protein
MLELHLLAEYVDGSDWCVIMRATAVAKAGIVAVVHARSLSCAVAVQAITLSYCCDTAHRSKKQSNSSFEQYSALAAMC